MRWHREHRVYPSSSLLHLDRALWQIEKLREQLDVLLPPIPPQSFELFSFLRNLPVGNPRHRFVTKSISSDKDMSISVCDVLECPYVYVIGLPDVPFLVCSYLYALIIQWCTLGFLPTLCRTRFPTLHIVVFSIFFSSFWFMSSIYAATNDLHNLQMKCL